jgi:hypothetical protein
VNNAKFIHVLLVAVLFYGQYSANTHIVGHIHEQIDVSGTAPHACDTHHGFAPSFSTTHQHNCTAPSDTKHTAEMDCGIYHAFLSLGGIFCDGLNQRYLPLPQFVNVINPPSNQYKVAKQLAQIRAPPKLS